MDALKAYQYTAPFSARAGNHPAAVEMREIAAEVAKLAERFDPLPKVYEDARRAAEKELKYRFTFEPVEVKYRSSFDNIPEDCIRLNVTAHAEGEAFERYRDQFGEPLPYFGSSFGKPGDKKSTVQTVSYFRKNGVLGHGGGGYLVFEDYTPMTDEEWAEFKKGNIDKKFFSENMLAKSV